MTRTREIVPERLRARIREACLALALAALAVGCGDFGGTPGAATPAPTASSGDPGIPVVPASGGDPVVGMGAFEQTAYPLLVDYCAECHAGSGPGSPSISHPDVQSAYFAVLNNQKVNFATPSSSRLVRRLSADFHHCWNNCMTDGMAMEAAIAAWAQMVIDAGGAGGGAIEGVVATAPLSLGEGIEDTGLQRYPSNLIALLEFKEGKGAIARDTSGMDPPMDLALQGPTWMSNYGIRIETGRAIATLEGSQKIYDSIASPQGGSQQYTVEAWIIPDNVDLEGPARILTYSRSTEKRNFTLGQVLYNYNFRNKSLATGADENGDPALQTADADQDLQATLQHVIITYDQFRGRRIFVNAQHTDDPDPLEPGRLWTWSDIDRFIVGNELTNDRQWVGRVQLVAIYDHALTEAQILQNFQAGVGRRLILRFDISQFIGPGGILEVQVSELDEYSYLVCRPTILTPSPNGFRAAHLRVGVSGVIPVSGQAFVNVDTFITSPTQELSRTCSILPKDRGAALDTFYIEFEYLGNFENLWVADPPPAVPPPVFGPPIPREGLRDFARINASMAAMTGVDPLVVRDTFIEIQQQLPSGYDVQTFNSSNQVGIAKLALEYCDGLVETPMLRDDFFGPGFGWNDSVPNAFPDTASRDRIVHPLIDTLLGVNVPNQPDRTDVEPVLNGLFADLTMGCTDSTCPGSRTRAVTKGLCAAVLSSAAFTIH